VDEVGGGAKVKMQHPITLRVLKPLHLAKTKHKEKVDTNRRKGERERERRGARRKRKRDRACRDTIDCSEL
jgi:hypothetical protein